MSHILKNQNLELHIDFPAENYIFPRFDQTGKIVKVKYQNISLSGVEKTDGEDEHRFGRGFYNEFGIDTPLGFTETNIGGWFHKIGVGLLKKEDVRYSFIQNYMVKSPEYTIITKPNKIEIICKSQLIFGYSYLLRKEIELFESGFKIKYFLQNTGDKVIVTDEYVHNFLAINKDLIGNDYLLKFPFQLKSALFEDTVNPEKKVEIGEKEITFNSTPNAQFFFSNLTGGETVDAKWELINLKNKIGISETGSFQTNKVNLWGWKHVISPELFYNIFIQSGQSTNWTRIYNVFKVK